MNLRSARVLPLALAALACTPKPELPDCEVGQLLRRGAAGWECADPTGDTIDPTRTPIVAACGTGQHVRWNGVAWDCEEPSAIDPAKTPVLEACGEGRVVRRTATGWECAAFPESAPKPPTCTGERALAWDGVAWGCVELGTLPFAKTSDVDAVAADLVAASLQITTVKGEVDAVEGEVAGLKTGLGAVQTDLGGVMSDVAGVQTELGGVKADVSGVKTVLAGVKDEVTTARGTETTLGSRLDGFQGDIAGIESELGERSVRRAFFNSNYFRTDLQTTAVPDRTITVQKKSASTALKIEYTDYFDTRSGSGNPCLCRWELKFNGSQCKTPGRFNMPRGVLADAPSNAGMATVMGYCTETFAGPLGAGPVTIDVHVFASDSLCECGSGRLEGSGGSIQVSEIR